MKRAKCRQCAARAGRRTTMYCDYHAGYHAGRQSIEMKAKRAANPAYREKERVAVKARMRRLRADRAPVNTCQRPGATDA